MQTDAQLRATKASKQRRIAAGERQFTVWLSKEAGDRLDELTAKYGTRQRAMESVLMGLDPGNGRLSIKRIEPGPIPTWPSGALMEPWHEADPELTLGSALTVAVKAVQKPSRVDKPAYGSRLKKLKGTK